MFNNRKITNKNNLRKKISLDASDLKNESIASIGKLSLGLPLGPRDDLLGGLTTNFRDLSRGKVDIKMDALKGRSLQTTRDIPIATEILDEDPLISVISNTHRKSHCSKCFNRMIQVCSKCKFIGYCNITCQRNDWNDHKVECEFLQAKGKFHPSWMQRMLLRALIKLSSDDGLFLKETRSLQSHRKETDLQDLELFGQMLMVVKPFVQTMKGFDSAELLDLLCKFAVNNVGIWDSEGISVGVGLYRGISAVNHSCRPNAVLTFKGPRATLKTVQSMKPGEELRIGYIDNLLGKQQRLDLLKREYHFKCDCESCVATVDCRDGFICRNAACDTGMFSIAEPKCIKCGESASAVTLTECLHALQEADRELKDTTSVKAIQSTHSTLRSLQKVVAVGNSVCTELLNRMREYLLDTGNDWPLLLEIEYASIEQLKAVYGQVHPLISVRYYSLFKIHRLTTRDLSIVLGSGKIAVDNLSITHGTRDSLYKEAYDDMQDFFQYFSSQQTTQFL